MWRNQFRSVVGALALQRTTEGARQFFTVPLWLVLLTLLVSCTQTTGSNTTSSEAGDAGVAAFEPTPQPAPTLAAPTAIPTVGPTATRTPNADVVTLDDLAILPEHVQLFPIPAIIAGDRVTFQIQPQVPANIIVESVMVDIYVDDQRVASGALDSRNMAGNAQGVYEWVWDTNGRPGYHNIRVVLDSEDLIKVGDLDPTNNETAFSVRVGKSSEQPLEERGATWLTSETDCCIARTITRTAAYRDFPQLLALLDSSVSKASSRLNEFPENKIDVYFIDRAIGQGGYAGSDMVIVYNDRNYINGEMAELLTHEAVHVIDRQFAPQRIEMLAEGVAVWASDGHYWPQDLQQRAAALVRLNRYIPLSELADNFYPAQHEIGYLEAGAFVDYLVSRFGWLDVRDFYSNTAASDAATQAAALDLNLTEHFGQSLAQIEAEWLAELGALSPSNQEIDDLRTTLRYFDTARAYQQKLDPTAYFRTAWLPSPEDVIASGNPADFLRQRDSEINLTIELMLRTTYDSLRAQEYRRAQILLDSVERYLAQDEALADPLVSTYRAIVKTAVAFGYEPQRVTLDGDRAAVLATTASGNSLINLDLELRRGDWILNAN